jgi:hypothetical protein
MPNCSIPLNYSHAGDSLSMSAWMTNTRHPQITVVVNNSDDQDHWSGLRRDKLVAAAMNQPSCFTRSN